MTAQCVSVQCIVLLCSEFATLAGFIAEVVQLIAPRGRDLTSARTEVHFLAALIMKRV